MADSGGIEKHCKKDSPLFLFYGVLTKLWEPSNITIVT